MTGVIELDAVSILINRKAKEIRIKGRSGRRTFTHPMVFTSLNRASKFALKIAKAEYKINVAAWS